MLWTRYRTAGIFALALFSLLSAAVGLGRADPLAVDLSGHPAAAVMYLSDEHEAELAEDEQDWVREASLVQPQPLVRPSLEAQPQTAQPAEAARISANLFGTDRANLESLTSMRRAAASQTSADLISGGEAKIRVSTDSGNLLGKSPSALGVGVQRRTPIVTDPRIRGSRVGSLAASGSYWVPARMDLDTALSKIDSRIVSDIVVMNGPFSTAYGPGFSVLDVQLLQSPRFEDGFEAHGRTSLDYKLNGRQVYGRQEVWGGSDDYGFRIGYGHATGNDYLSGDGTRIPASYNVSRF